MWVLNANKIILMRFPLPSFLPQPAFFFPHTSGFSESVLAPFS
jgi:hypothetical protein